MAIMPQRIWKIARAVLAAWAALFFLIYVVERNVLVWTAPLLSSWLPTAQLGLECMIFAAAGWIAGRLNRMDAAKTVIAFALTLALWGFEGTLPVDVPWLLRLTVDALRDSRYVDSLVTTLTTNVILFGCLIAGGLLSRPRASAPASPLGIALSKPSGPGASRPVKRY